MNNDPQSTTDAQTMRRTRIASPVFWVVAAALVAVALKLCIALNTEGTNDVISFHQFASDLSQHGLEWTYRHRPKFNHPPLVSYFLRDIYSLGAIRAFQENGLTFPFLLRLPRIIADFVVVLLMLRLGAQYLVWWMPFLLVPSPMVFAYVAAACSLFMFFFYKAIAAGLPWNLAVSNNGIADQWVPWVVWPWLTFVAALTAEWLDAAAKPVGAVAKFGVSRRFEPMTNERSSTGRRSAIRRPASKRSAEQRIHE